jgi:hypothetical protein
MKRIRNLQDYKDVLPYASEIFGVYLPLLGWKSKRIARRFEHGYLGFRDRILSSIAAKLRPEYTAQFGSDCQIELSEIHPAAAQGSFTHTSWVMQAVAKNLPPLEEYKPKVWDRAIQEDQLQNVLSHQVKEGAMVRYRELCTRQVVDRKAQLRNTAG